jgi:hypothetical protein
VTELVLSQGCNLNKIPPGFFPEYSLEDSFIPWFFFTSFQGIFQPVFRENLGILGNVSTPRSDKSVMVAANPIHNTQHRI